MFREKLTPSKILTAHDLFLRDVLTSRNPSPNEYIRGMVLRFLCKLREPELIEPLLSSARSCLEHRHAYVRKNAVFAVSSIYTHFESLIPDAPELIQTFLEGESDHTCKRNAFAALTSMNHDKALEYLSSAFDAIPNADELLQLVELEFIRKDAVQNAQNKVWAPLLSDPLSKFFKSTYNNRVDIFV